jgi:predicted permease
MWMNDLRLAARTLRKSPLFSLGVVGLLAFGMAACLVIFTLVDLVLLRPLPVRDPVSLVRFVSIHPPLPPMGDFRLDEFDAWKREAVGPSFLELIAWSTGDATVVVGRGSSESVRVDFVTDNYFSALGVEAALGTLLTAAEGSAPAVLSYPYWQRRFGGDRSVIGQTIEFEGHKVTIVGVTAKGFNGLTLETSPDLRLPAKWMRELRFVAPDVYQYVGYEVAGRLRPGVNVEAARQQAEQIWTSVRKSDPTGTAMLDAKLELQSAAKGISRLRGPFGGVLWLVLAGVALLLLIVCANAAGLLVTRAAGRQAELAIRVALGATRGQLAGPLLAEAVLLLSGAMALAAGLTYAALPLVAGSLPPVRDQGTVRLTLSLDLVPDLRVAAVGLGISALTLALFGLLPAWATVFRNRGHEALQRTLQQARHRHTGRQLLIAVQVALCTILLCGAGLTLLTLDRLRGLDPGFDAGRVVTFTVDRGLEKYEKAQILDLQRRLLAGARALPEVDSAAIATRGLMRGSGIKMTVLPAGQSARREDFMNTSLNSVTPDYFATMRMKWVAGRNFVEGEVREGVPTPVVVNEAFARKLGARLGGKFGSSMPRGGKPAEPQFEVIGIVGDAKYRSLREPMQPTLYSPLGANPSLILHVHTRTARPEVIMQPVRRLLAEADPRLSFVEVASLATEVADSIWPERAAAWLASVFAGAAMVIVAAGLYALAAFAVMQRRREIGIRMALGALPGDILRLMLTRVTWLSLGGVAVGLFCSWLIAPQVQSVLYEVRPRDPRSLFGAVAVVLGVTMLAAMLPSLRAARMAPATVLRDE